LPAVDQPAGQPLIAPVTNSSPAVPHNATSVTAGNEPERNDGRNQSTPLGTVPEKSAITDPVIIGNKVYQAVNKTRENAAIAANAQSADPAAQSNARITVGEPTSVNSASTRLGEPSVFSHTPNPQRRAANRTVNAGKKP
jgi:hypothetical protein